MMQTVGGQLNFLDIVVSDRYWVRIRPNSGHCVYRSGEMFLVVEQSDGFLLCWRDGIVPRKGHLGSLIHERYVEGADRPFGGSW